MSKLQKTMFILAAIFSLLGGIVALIAFIAIVGYPSFTPYVLTDVLNEMGYIITLSFVEQFYIGFAITAGLMFVVHVWIMIISFNNALSKKQIVPSGIQLVTLIVAWLFSNLFCAVTFSVGVFFKPTTLQNDTVVKPNNEAAITKEIQNIRALYQKGAITKEEYDRLIKEVFNKLEV